MRETLAQYLGIILFVVIYSIKLLPIYVKFIRVFKVCEVFMKRFTIASLTPTSTFSWVSKDLNPGLLIPFLILYLLHYIDFVIAIVPLLSEQQNGPLVISPLDT